MLSPRNIIGPLQIWLAMGMLLVGVCFSVIAQEPIITPIPTNTPVDSSSQSGIHLGMQTAENGNTYLNWTMVPPAEDPSPINSDIEWLVGRLNESVSHPPVMLPPAPIPQPGSNTIRSIDITVINPHQHSFQIQGPLPTVLSIPHKKLNNGCEGNIRTSFYIAEGVATSLIVSNAGICDRCRRNPLKSFHLNEGRYNSGEAEHVEYIRSKDSLYIRGAEETIIWQIMDQDGNALQSKNFDSGDYAARESYNLSTYNGGNYVRILPITLEAPHNDDLGANSFEPFNTYKEIAGLAYNGNVGDKALFYVTAPNNPFATDDAEEIREVPWIVSSEFYPGPATFNKLEAEIVEVIEGPQHKPDVFNWFTPEYFPYFLGLDDDYSPFEKIVHPYCGEVPIDFRAVILRTKSKDKKLSRLILALKGSEFNRSDWIQNDIPQYFGSIPDQYIFSKMVAKYVEQINSTGQPLTVVGHSLGGGMAQYVVGARAGWNWKGFGFNPATLGAGGSMEVASVGRSTDLMARFTVIQNVIDPVSNAGGWLLGNRWVLESAGHTLGSMDLTRIQTVLPAPSKSFNLGTGDQSNTPTITSPPLLPGFVNQQFSDFINP